MMLFFFKWKSSMDFLLQTKERARTVITGQESNSHGIMTSSFMSINKTLPGLPSERSCVKNVLGQSHPGSTPLYLSWSWQILDTDTQNICIPGLHFPENLLPGGWSRIQEYLFCNSLYDSPEFKNPFPAGQFSSLQSLSRVQLFATPWTAARQASLPITNSRSPPWWWCHLIQPSHPLSSPSPPALNLSQHQGLFQWVNPSHEVAKVLEFQLQHQSFQWTSRTDLL